MPKIQYKSKTGALHVGGGRFFYASTPVDVKAEEWEELKHYADLEEVASDKEGNKAASKGKDTGKATIDPDKDNKNADANNTPTA